MDAVRRTSLLIGAALLGTAVLIGWVGARPSMSANAARDLAGASGYFDSTIVLARAAAPRGVRGDQLTVALAYLERLRTGLGSPFQLIDDALHDPRLPRTMQSRVGWALLARLRRGDAYVIDPAVLDGLGPWDDAGAGASGAAHLALIERTIRQAPDPRAGELTVRLAYMLAVARGSISPGAVSLATDAAALVRDRELAIRDANDALADAGARHEDVLALLQSRRAEHALRVEAPALAPLPSAQRVSAIDAVPGVVAAIDTLERVDRAGAPPLAPSADSALIGPAFARRLATLGARRPPRAPVVVMLRTHRGSGVAASNEETLIAALDAGGTARSDSARRVLARAVLASAVALRPFAQEAPWFAGDPAPAASDLTTEFGLGSVTFTRGVPEAWRPYYLRELEHAIDDMRRVLPSASFDGLNVRFTAQALPDSALALHDPRTRTLELSIMTSAGTIAHELTHDLDWQSARRLFSSGGGYGTDRAARERRGPLAASVRGLADSRTVRAYATAGSAPLTDRPAELFARSTDWYVASALAAQGRTDGFLSAVQDAMLAGYAAGGPTIAGQRAASSVLAALDEMTLIPDSSRAAFERTWSDPAAIDPAMLVRRVLDTPVSWRAVWAERDAGARGLAAAPIPAAVCTPDDGPEMRARRALVAMAIDARARGVAERWARHRGAGPAVDWANGLLGVAPWSPENGAPMLDALRDAITRAVVESPAAHGVVPVVPPIFRSNAASCSLIDR